MTLLRFLTGDHMMRLLVCLYVLTAALFAFERNWPRMVYWLGAATITSSVIWMKG